MPDFSQFGGFPGGGGFSFSSSSFGGPGGGYDPFSTFNSMFGNDFNIHNHYGQSADPFAAGMGGNPFGGSHSFSAGGPRNSTSRTATQITGVTPTIEHEIQVSLEELSQGCTKKFNIKRDKFTSGRLQREAKLFVVDVKKGWKDGTKVRYPQEANEEHGKLPGDIVFIIKSKPHSVFTRENENLIYRQPISLADALSGADKEYQIPLLNCDFKVSLRTQREVITPNTEKRISGQGLPIQKTPNVKGDLIVRFDVMFPELTRGVQEAARLLKDSEMEY